jgi:hypothetical protein
MNMTNCCRYLPNCVLSRRYGNDTGPACQSYRRTEFNDDGQSMGPSVSVASVTAAMFAAAAIAGPCWIHTGAKRARRDSKCK